MEADHLAIYLLLDNLFAAPLNACLIPSIVSMLGTSSITSSCSTIFRGLAAESLFLSSILKLQLMVKMEVSQIASKTDKNMTMDYQIPMNGWPTLVIQPVNL